MQPALAHVPQVAVNVVNPAMTASRSGQTPPPTYIEAVIAGASIPHAAGEGSAGTNITVANCDLVASSSSHVVPSHTEAPDLTASFSNTADPAATHSGSTSEAAVDDAVVEAVDVPPVKGKGKQKARR